MTNIPIIFFIYM